MDLSVPEVHCGSCIVNIERACNKVEGVTKARVNLSTKRLSLEWKSDTADAGQLVSIVENLGYQTRPFETGQQGRDDEEKHGQVLLRSIAVAGFAAANIMLLSVSVWSGAEGTTRQLFHWLSALIAIPAVLYAGRPFYHSALKALRHAHLNMDVPISLAVLLATFMSLYETIIGGAETYFDASVMLLFFLLIGRYLDHMMRARARSAVTGLLTLNATGATIINDEGEKQYIPVGELKTGMRVAVMAGERVPVDGEIIAGTSDVDRSIVTGESLPETLAPGSKVQAGIMNLTGPIELIVTATGKDTFLGEVIQLMEAAEEGKARYMRIADRAAQIYAPAVHLVAAVTFLGWLWWSGGDWHAAIFTAISVLIITCPCALGLAVPAVQIVASGLLFNKGLLIKDGTVLERMAGVDTVVFDKTGTLTSGSLQVVDTGKASLKDLSIAMGLAQNSSHPLAKSLAAYCASMDIKPSTVENIVETPGLGISGIYQGVSVAIGRSDWFENETTVIVHDIRSRISIWVDGKSVAMISFEDSMRAGVRQTIAGLKQRGLEIFLLSGDHEQAVRQVASFAGIDNYHFGLTPKDKAGFITDLQDRGASVLMVGDGINDAPALASADASIAPSTASDIGRTAAGLVFTGDNLAAIYTAIDIATRANSHIRQNFALAIAYNIIAVPLAIFGFASPLIAAVAMSASSIAVTSNALRLRLGKFSPPAMDGDAAVEKHTAPRKAHA